MVIQFTENHPKMLYGEKATVLSKGRMAERRTIYRQNRKQNGPWYCRIGFLRMPNTMVKSKMTSLPVSLAKQEVTAFHWLICFVFTGKGFLGMPNAVLEPKMSSFSVLLAKQEVTAFLCRTILQGCFQNESETRKTERRNGADRE